MIAAAVAAGTLLLAVVTQDQSGLRAAPSSNAATHAQLWQGDLLEVRGQRLDHLQVYDHRRERAGYVRAGQVRMLGDAEADAPQLLAVLRFLRDAPGNESLGIAYAAAYLKAAPIGHITTEPFDAVGIMAERLARRAGTRQLNTSATTAHMEVAGQYGVKFTAYETEGRIRLCYDGEAFRRVVAMAVAMDAPRATPEHLARAVLALTRHDCLDPALRPHERKAVDESRADVLDLADASVTAQLDAVTKNRLHVRRAGVWAAIAFGKSRRGEVAQAAAQRALDELAAVNKTELGDEESADYTEASIRVGAVRWAAAPFPALAARLQLRLHAGEPGQTCVALIDASGKSDKPLGERCTYATVWAASARPSPDHKALVVAVQPIEGWSELWVWRQRAQGWTLDVIPPDSAGPGLGYVEFAGWAPRASRKLLVARESKVAGRASRRFEVLRLDTLGTDKSASSVQQLPGFVQWADAGWKRGTLSLR